MMDSKWAVTTKLRLLQYAANYDIPYCANFNYLFPSRFWARTFFFLFSTMFCQPPTLIITIER